MAIYLSTPAETPQLTLAGPSCTLPWQERCEWFRAKFEHTPPPHLSVEEVQAHFSTMPSHYWERVDESDFVWGLEAVHGFLKLMASPHAAATAAFVSWRQAPDFRSARLMLCTWDRHGLLAKAAASFSAVRLNIVQADIFTRADNIVLDEFWINPAGGWGPMSDSRLQEATFLLDGALSEPPRFVSVWACSRHKFLASPNPVSPRINFDNQVSPDSTVIHIEAPDRLGLLYDILQAMADNGLNIKQARIETRGQLACDTIHVTDQTGQKIVNESALKSLCAKLQTAVSPED
jgi:[protein-PII] uridylyltransferase